MDVNEQAESKLRYHHGDLRGALIAAGRAILEESGPRALTLREAARRANVSHAAPKHHFPTLRAFLGDCAADGFSEFDERLNAAAKESGTASEALEAMGRAYLRFARNNRAMFRLMFDRDSFSDGTVALQKAGSQAYATLISGVSATDPDMSSHELDFRVAAIWSIVHGFAGLVLEDKICQTSDETPEDFAARAIRCFLRGV